MATSVREGRAAGLRGRVAGCGGRPGGGGEGQGEGLGGQAGEGSGRCCRMRQVLLGQLPRVRGEVGEGGRIVWCRCRIQQAAGLGDGEVVACSQAVREARISSAWRWRVGWVSKGGSWGGGGKRVWGVQRGKARLQLRSCSRPGRWGLDRQSGLGRGGVLLVQRQVLLLLLLLLWGQWLLEGACPCGKGRVRMWQGRRGRGARELPQDVLLQLLGAQPELLQLCSGQNRTCRARGRGRLQRLRLRFAQAAECGVLRLLLLTRGLLQKCLLLLRCLLLLERLLHLLLWGLPAWHSALRTCCAYGGPAACSGVQGRHDSAAGRRIWPPAYPSLRTPCALPC